MLISIMVDLVFIILPYMAIFGLMLSLAAESLAMTNRIYFESVNLSTLSVSTSKIIMLINRFGVALCMPVVGLLIDINVESSQISLIYVCGFLFAGVSILFFTTNSYFINYTSIKILKYFWKKEFKKRIVIQNTKKYSMRGFFVGGLQATGLSAPALTAIKFPEYGTFLIQTGFLINSFAAVSNVFVIDLNNSKSLMKDKMSLSILIDSRGKALSFIFASLIIFIFYK